MTGLSSASYFPPAESALEGGLVYVGGRLSPDWLLDAYSHGIFPWPSNEEHLSWFSPDPRAILELGNLHVSRRLSRTCRQRRFQVTFDKSFDAVLSACAAVHTRRRGGTWLTPAMQCAYRRLHALGFAHSVEAWLADELAGGVYGVALGGMFSAESMFYEVSDASKVALVHLVQHLRARGYVLLDVQQSTGHLQRFGATQIPRSVFLERLAEALKLPIEFSTSVVQRSAL
jgi:leucyl/phenylalanyl-tRNA--protein transferase